MAISLNSVVSFNSTMLQSNSHDASRCSVGVSLQKPAQFTSFLVMPGSRFLARGKRYFGYCLSVADSDQLATGTSDKDSSNAERSPASNQLHSLNPPAENAQFQANVNAGLGTQASESSIGSTNKNQVSADSSDSQSTTKRLPLTARERLRAARVLSRYTESKASKSGMGSNVLDALKESERGKKKSRLPEAPMNLFDDSKRGLPKPGLTFQFPGGFDLFIIVVSFVLISTLMFATTYFVWKVGAIHFNEY